jgi:hypothetical protein
MGYCYPSGLENTLCKWDYTMYVMLVTKVLIQFLLNRVGWIDRNLFCMYRNNYSCHVSDM